jgi:DNA-binding PadR family transcriptional regulator
VATSRSLPLAIFHILVSLADQERHGYAIMQDVHARTDGQLRLGPEHSTDRSSGCCTTG